MTYILGATLLGLAGCLVGHALASPVLWIEFGERLRYRKPLGLRTREWRDVRLLGFEDEPSRVDIDLGIAIPLGTHRILVLTLSDGSELRVKVTPEQEVRVQGSRLWWIAARPRMPLPAAGTNTSLPAMARRLERVGAALRRSPRPGFPERLEDVAHLRGVNVPGLEPVELRAAPCAEGPRHGGPHGSGPLPQSPCMRGSVVGPAAWRSSQ